MISPRLKMYLSRALLLALVVGNFFIFHTVLAPATRTLTVSFLDVGQGDAIFIQAPGGAQMLVDGGPDRSVLRELSKQMPPWDRTLDAVVETHPDKDHIAGLAGVLGTYQVKNYFEPGIPDTTAISQEVLRRVEEEPGITHVIARRGMRVHLSGGAYADVLFPDRDESKQTVTNDGSIVLHVVYGQTSFMLTGDLPSPYEDFLVGLDGKDGELVSTVLKAGHHGSKYSTDRLWLTAVHPEYVVVSAGKDNTYGHPNDETLARIRAEGARLLSTIDHGTITFHSDGTILTVQ